MAQWHEPTTAPIPTPRSRRDPDETRQEWERRYAATPERDEDFTTLSEVDVPPLVGPHNYTPDLEQDRLPGRLSVHARRVSVDVPRPSRGRSASSPGFGSVEDTNKRYHDLLKAGQHGLSVAFDMPTLMGRDSDEPESRRARSATAASRWTRSTTSQRLFDGIPLGDITTSMTINGPAVVLFAMYAVAAERQGFAIEQLGGTLQTDIHKEYIAQKEWLFPPEPHLRLIGDLMEFTTAQRAALPPDLDLRVSHPRGRLDGGAGARVHAGRRLLLRGAGQVARPGTSTSSRPRLSFFFDSHIDFFEEIGKFRAGRRIWARWMKERYGATADKAMLHALPHADRRRVADRAAA